MGRHSRKGRARTGPTPERAERTAVRGDVPSYEPSPDAHYGTVHGAADDEGSYETASIYRTGGYYTADAYGAEGYDAEDEDYDAGFGASGYEPSGYGASGYDVSGYETVSDEPSVFERQAPQPSYAARRTGPGPGGSAPAPVSAPAAPAAPAASAASPAPSAPSASPARTGQGPRPAARGGHPEQREPGGGWGADGAGRGPGGTDGAAEAGRVLQARSGGFGQNPEQGPGPYEEERRAPRRPARSAGPGARREDAQVFGGGAPGGAPRGGTRTGPHGGPHAGPDAVPRSAATGAPPVKSPSSAAGSAAGVRTPLPRYGDGGGASAQAARGSGPDSRTRPGRSLIDPGRAPLRASRAGRASVPERRQFLEGRGTATFPAAGARTDKEREPGSADVAAGAGPPQVPGMRSGLRNSGPAGRALTGVLAVAVATVLAFVVAGQLSSDVSEDGKNPQARGLGAGEPAPRTAKDGTEAEAPAAPSYDVKMARTYPLRPELKGQGDFTAVSGSQKGAGGGTVLRYRVDVEKGLPLDSTLFASAVHKTLNDKRSWAGDGRRSFERVAKGDVDFVITLASSPTTDEWCAKSGLDTSEQNVSCDSASTDRVMINAYRWAQGSKTFGDDRIFGYRQMLINHEVGHRIGLDHVGCPKDGDLAPVMMQQTKSLESDGKKCRPNPWVRPDA